MGRQERHSDGETGETVMGDRRDTVMGDRRDSDEETGETQ